MHNRKNTRMLAPSGTLVAAAFALGLGSCQFAVDDITAPVWQPDILGPVAKSTLQIDNLDQLAVFDASAYVTAANMGLTPGVQDGGGMRSGVTIGPYAFDWLEDIVGLETGEATVRFKVKNELPVGMAEGASVVLRQASTGAEVARYDLGQDLAAFGRMADSAAFVDLAFAAGLELWIEGMNLTPEQGETIEPGMGMQIDAQVELTGIRRVDVAAGAALAFADTVDFTLDLVDDFADLEVDGAFRLNVGNGFPFGGRLDAIFLGADGVTVIDRLNADPIEIPIPAVGGTGEAVETASTTITVAVDRARLETLRDAAFVGFDAEIYAPSSPSVLRATGDRAFDLQLIADFEFTVQP
jgi:hypothetical protein